MADYQELHDRFAQARKDFKKIETTFRNAKKPRTARAIKRCLEQFQHWLETFSDLQYEMDVEGGLKGRGTSDFRHDSEGVKIILGKLQFNYVLPLSQRLSDVRDRNNVLLAAFSILIGLLCTLYSLYYTHVDSQAGTKVLLKEDSLIEARLKLQPVIDSSNSHRCAHKP